MEKCLIEAAGNNDIIIVNTKQVFVLKIVLPFINTSCKFLHIQIQKTSKASLSIVFPSLVMCRAKQYAR